MSLIRLLDVSDEFDDDGIETYVFDIVVDKIERTVGRIEFRYESGRDLLYYGNIGYVIYLPYRGHNYAYHACIALRAYLYILDPSMKSCMITCNPDNTASKKTILKLGAQYVECVDVAADHELFSSGDYQKEVYRWDF